MAKQCVNWKTIVCTNVNGDEYHAEFPYYINRKYRGELVTEILAMPKRKPIQFDVAVRMAADNFFRAKIGHGRGENFWFIEHFIEWISEIGFHIELTGDEFEPIVQPGDPQ